MRSRILLISIIFLFYTTAIRADGFASIDLSALAEEKLINLQGEWNFAWKKLVYPDQIASIDPSEVARVKVPQKWNDYTLHGVRLTADGFATYWIDLVFPEKSIGMDYAIFLPEIPTAYKLWMNSETLISNGTIGTDKSTSVPRGYPDIAFFVVTQYRMRLLIQVSNFHDYNGGIWKRLIIGSREDVLALKATSIAFDLFFFGGLLAIGIYHLILFLIRKKEKSILYFSIACISIAARSLFTGEFYFSILIPDFPWPLYIQLNFFLIYAAVFAFALFIAHTYEKHFHKVVKYAGAVITGIFLVLLFVTLGKVYLFSWEIYQYFLVVIFIYILVIISRAIIEKVEGALINIVSFGITFICICNDILYGKALIQSINLSAMGLFSFTISQSAILALKYTSTFKKMEIVSSRLQNASLMVEKKNRLIESANKELKELYSELDTSQKEITYRLSQIAETRSRETGNHVKRVAAYVFFLAREYGLSPEESELLENAAPMHDVGKMAIPDEILNKQGKLTPGEFETIKAHTTIGHAILQNSGRKILNAASIIALEHHERYNGTGYPDGKAGESIHIYGRIVAVADVFDALASDRCYKKAWPLDKILEYFNGEVGGHFDPKLSEIFLKKISEFENILAKYEDKFNL
jgi:response regulator RpfG family c-di-GMP phosphodiesterase